MPYYPTKSWPSQGNASHTTPINALTIDDVLEAWKLSITYLHSHGINIDLLVEIVEECDSLHNHGINLVWGKLELEAAIRQGERGCKDDRIHTEIMND